MVPPAISIQSVSAVLSGSRLGTRAAHHRNSPDELSWRILCVIQYVAHRPMSTDQFPALRLELRRGCLILAVLAQLRVEHYGYTLKRELFSRGMVIDEVCPRKASAC